MKAHLVWINRKGSRKQKQTYLCVHAKLTTTIEKILIQLLYNLETSTAINFCPLFQHTERDNIMNIKSGSECLFLISLHYISDLYVLSYTKIYRWQEKPFNTQLSVSSKILLA